MRAIIFRFPISKPVNETDTIGLHLLYLVHCIFDNIVAWIFFQIYRILKYYMTKVCYYFVVCLHFKVTICLLFYRLSWISYEHFQTTSIMIIQMQMAFPNYAEYYWRIVCTIQMWNIVRWIFSWNQFHEKNFVKLISRKIIFDFIFIVKMNENFFYLCSLKFMDSRLFWSFTWSDPCSHSVK